MRVRLVVERSEAGEISAMVWAVDDDDPRLLDSKQFHGDAAFSVWLAGIATRYGRGSITMDWTESLKADDRLAAVVKQFADPAV